MPCDGIDDLCKNSEDENCFLEIKLVIIFTAIGSFAMLLSTIIIANFIFKIEVSETECIELVNKHERNEDLLAALKSIKHGHHSEERDLMEMMRMHDGEEERYSLAKIIAKFEFVDHKADLQEMCFCIRSKFGTNDLTKHFFKCLKEEQHSPFLKFKIFISRLPQVTFLSQSKRIIQGKYFMKSILQITVYYVDFTKDLYLFSTLLKIVKLDNTFFSFEWQIIFLTFISIAVPQLLNILFLSAYVITTKRVTKLPGIMLCFFSLTTPAVVIYIVGKLEAGQRLIVSQATWIQWKLWKLRFSLLKMIEIVFESSLQFLILLIVILISKSNTKNVSGLESLFASDDVEMLVLSCTWSLLSIVITETNWQDSVKSFAIGIQGKLIMAGFFLLSILPRTCAVILYFAPSMGLLGLQGHYTLGKIKPNFPEFHQLNNHELEMDHKKLWKPILNGADMAIWSWQIFYIIFIIFVPVHQFLIFIVKCFYANNFLSRKNMLLKLFNVINQQFCPKIYQDWDENASNLEEVRKNYGDVKKEMKVLLTLFAVENILLCTPMIMLSVKIYERNKYLDEFFPQLDEEIWSTKLAYSLSAVCPIFFCVTPFFQYWLFLLYNNYGHPWAILLQDKFDAPDWLKRNDLFLDEKVKSNLGMSEDDIKELFCGAE